MKAVFMVLCVSLFGLAVSGCSTFKTDDEKLEGEGAGTFLVSPSGKEKGMKEGGVSSCSCPGFSYNVGTGILTRTYYASQCSASCPSPKYASCSCRATSYSVAGAYYNACRCK